MKTLTEKLVCFLPLAWVWAKLALLWAVLSAIGMGFFVFVWWAGLNLVVWLVPEGMWSWAKFLLVMPASMVIAAPMIAFLVWLVGRLVVWWTALKIQGGKGEQQ